MVYHLVCKVSWRVCGVLVALVIGGKDENVTSARGCRLHFSLVVAPHPPERRQSRSRRGRLGNNRCGGVGGWAMDRSGTLARPPPCCEAGRAPPATFRTSSSKPKSSVSFKGTETCLVLRRVEAPSELIERGNSWARSKRREQKDSERTWLVGAANHETRARVVGANADAAMGIRENAF